MISAAGIAGLERLPKLHRFSCGGETLGDDRLAALIRNKGLTHLFLASARLTHAQCQTLVTSFPGLTSLNLMNNKTIDDQAVAPFAELRGLNKIQLQGTSVTSAGIEELKKKLPNCSIEWDQGTR
jgi:hypothetical protein